MKNEMGGRRMKVFLAMRPKIYNYLPDDGYVDKKAMGTKKCVIKCKIKFEDYKRCPENNKTIVRSEQRFWSEAHTVCTEKS